MSAGVNKEWEALQDSGPPTHEPIVGSTAMGYQYTSAYL